MLLRPPPIHLSESKTITKREHSILNRMPRSFLLLGFLAFFSILSTACGPVLTTEASNTSLNMSSAATRLAILGAVDKTLAQVTTVDFGAARLNTSADKEVLIGNIGKLEATSLGSDDSAALAAPFGFKGGTFPGTGGTCGSSLQGGAICSIVLTFSPTTEGTYSSTFKLKYSNGLVSMPIELKIEGKTSGRLLWTSPSSLNYLNFGENAVASSADLTITLTNPGSTTVSSIAVASDHALAAPFSFAGGTYPGTSGTCSTSLESGSAGTCLLQIRFNPTVIGAYGDLVEITYHDGSSTHRLSIPVRGTTTGIALLQKQLRETRARLTSFDASYQYLQLFDLSTPDPSTRRLSRYLKFIY